MSAESGFTVQELARRLGAAFDGDGSVRVRDVATLESAGPAALSWVGREELLPRAAKSRAGALLIPVGCILPDRPVIRVDDPDDALCSVLEWLAPPPARVEPGVHATAVIGPEASVDGAAIGANVYVGAGSRVGAGTQLHPGAYVGANTSIGADCVIWPNAVIRERVQIGDRVVIHPGAVVGADGFGYLLREGRHKKIPQIGTVVIEDDVEIGALSAVDRARSGVTRVRRGVKIDNLCQIGHNCDIGEDCIIVGQSGISGSVILGDHCVVAGKAGIGDHVTIGPGSQIAAGSNLLGDVPAGSRVQGNPAFDIGRFRRAYVAFRKLAERSQGNRDMIKRIEALERKIEAFVKSQE